MKTSSFLFLFLLFVPAANAQEFAAEHLNNSPRHHEWLQIDAGDRTVHAFAAFPERSDDALAVLVIHENRGLTEWVRSFADQLAAAGYLAVAPDLLSGFDDEHERTSNFETSDAARDAIYQLDSDQVIADLRAVRSYIAEMPSSSGDVVVAGFCWGGSQTFRFATHTDDIEAALVFYGTAPEDEERIAAIELPVYGFYGGDDQRVNATIPATQERMDTFGKRYDIEIYDGAGHAFMRSGDDPAESGPNKMARDEAWQRLTAILAAIED